MIVVPNQKMYQFLISDNRVFSRLLEINFDHLQAGYYSSKFSNAISDISLICHIYRIHDPDKVVYFLTARYCLSSNAIVNIYPGCPGDTLLLLSQIEGTGQVVRTNTFESVALL